MFGYPDPHHVSIVEVARQFGRTGHGVNTGRRASCFAKPERSKEYDGKNNIARRAKPYPRPSPPKLRAVRGKAAVKAFKRAKQKARRNAE